MIDRTPLESKSGTFGLGRAINLQRQDCGSHRGSLISIHAMALCADCVNMYMVHMYIKGLHFFWKDGTVHVHQSCTDQITTLQLTSWRHLHTYTRQPFILLTEDCFTSLSKYLPTVNEMSPLWCFEVCSTLHTSSLLGAIIFMFLAGCAIGLTGLIKRCAANTDVECITLKTNRYCAARRYAS